MNENPIILESVLGASARLAVAGRYEAALGVLNGIPEPELPQARLLRGKIFAQLGRLQEAHSEFDAVKSAAPNSPEARLAHAAAAAIGGRSPWMLRTRLLAVWAGALVLAAGSALAIRSASGPPLDTRLGNLERSLSDKHSAENARTLDAISRVQGELAAVRAEQTARDSSRQRETAAQLRRTQQALQALHAELARLREQSR